MSLHNSGTPVSSMSPTGVSIPGPFVIKDCAALALALGRSARNLRELREGVAQVPIGSIYHHFFHTLLRPSFDDPEYRNDFALWARRQLHDAPLAERLAIVDPVALPGSEALREVLVEILEERLGEHPHVPVAAPGHEFHFLSSQIVVFATELAARDPEELAALVPRLTTGSVFFHFVDARFRPPRGEDDFSAWLALWGSATEQQRRRLVQIDPLFGSLGRLRSRVAASLAPEAVGVPA